MRYIVTKVKVIVKEVTTTETETIELDADNEWQALVNSRALDEGYPTAHGASNGVWSAGSCGETAVRIVSATRAASVAEKTETS